MNSRALRKLLLAILTAIAFASAVAAQSGRRGTTKSTAPITSSVPEPKAPETKPEKPPRLQFLVGIQDPSPFDEVPYYLADTVLEACLGRLHEAAGVIATAGSRRMTRGEAIKAAKAETERYVVWLELGSNPAGSAPQVQRSADQLYVSYSIFEPGTAKVRRSGLAQSGIYKGNVGVGGPSSRRGPVYSDYVVKQAAREAAEQILAAFGIKIEGPWPRWNRSRIPSDLYGIADSNQL